MDTFHRKWTIARREGGACSKPLVCWIKRKDISRRRSTLPRRRKKTWPPRAEGLRQTDRSGHVFTPSCTKPVLFRYFQPLAMTQIFYQDRLRLILEYLYVSSANISKKAKARVTHVKLFKLQNSREIRIQNSIFNCKAMFKIRVVRCAASTWSRMKTKTWKPPKLYFTAYCFSQHLQLNYNPRLYPKPISFGKRAVRCIYKSCCNVVIELAATKLLDVLV